MIIKRKEVAVNKTWLVAAVMVVGLGGYGYLLSSAGHDHAAHGGEDHHAVESSPGGETGHHE